MTGILETQFPKYHMRNGLLAQTACAPDSQDVQQDKSLWLSTALQTYMSVVSLGLLAVSLNLDGLYTLSACLDCSLLWGCEVSCMTLCRPFSSEAQVSHCWRSHVRSSYVCTSRSATGCCSGLRLLWRWLTAHAHAWPSPQLQSEVYPREASPAVSSLLCCTTPPPVPHSP